MSNPDDPATWLAKAENDLLNIRNNLAAERVPWDTVCFHAQQAAEKMLKAFLASRGQRLSRTHDLIALLAEAVAAGGPLEMLESDCRLLTPYAVLLRYPGAGEEPSESDGREAVAAAQRVYDQLRVSIDSP
ncbi:MAG: HEPN domain-containing protein [Phycisphaerae bacterium]|nr:HEPN domain-containing protein [Phycisphaerae bacterium]